MPSLAHLRHIKELLTQRFSEVSAFTLVPSLKELRTHYDVATFQADGRELVAKWRLPDDPSALEVEHATSGFLGAAGLPTAAVVAFDAAERLIVFEHLDGKSCTNEDLAAQAVQMADLLCRMHALPEAEAPLAIPRYPAGGFLAEVRARFDAVRHAGREFFSQEWGAVERAQDVLLAACRYEGLRGLCRTDPSPPNWILRPDGSLWMVDHESAAFADVANDLWRVQAYLSETGVLATFRDAYGADRFDAATHPTVCALLDIRRCIRVLTRPTPRKPAYEEICRVRLARAIAYARTECA